MFVYEGDEPLLLQCTVEGKPGFRVHPTNADDDSAILFSSPEALVAWTVELSEQVVEHQKAPHYEGWLETLQ